MLVIYRLDYDSNLYYNALMPFQKGNQLGELNKGRKASEETRAKLRAAAALKDKSFYRDPERNRRIAEAKTGERNALWAGDNVTRSQLHQWVRRHKPRIALCENCKLKPPIDLANISQEYHRDINDFKWLCRSCHMREDGRLNALMNNNKKWRIAKS